MDIDQQGIKRQSIWFQVDFKPTEISKLILLECKHSLKSPKFTLAPSFTQQEGQALCKIKLFN